MMTPPTPPANGGATPSQTSFLVKVYMDGLPIGRKVDLTTHNSYDKLKYALEDMFQQFIGNASLHLAHFALLIVHLNSYC
jgi:auxin-responsive protein IAA